MSRNGDASPRKTTHQEYRARLMRHDLTVTNRPIADLRPWADNPRVNDAAAERLAHTILTHGWTNPILLDRTGQIVAGHTRLKAAIKLGLTEVPTITLDAEGAEAIAIAIADNRLGELAEWDDPALARLLEGLAADDFDLDAIGYDDDEMQALLDSLEDEPTGPDDGELTEPPEEPDSAAGWVYELGPHRLACGDCGDPAIVAALMDGGLADACVTDPPYGQDQPGVTNDSPDALSGVVGGAVSAMPMSDGVCVAFASPRTFPEWLDAIRAGGHKFERMLWMYKEAQMANPWRGWILKSEAILVSTVGKGNWQEVHPYAHDCYKLASVNSKNSGFDADAHGWHGSVKPLVVVEDIVSRVCPRGGTLYEPFGGSGTTLIACARLGVIARLVELDPGYCDVIRKRWTTWADDAGVDAGPGALREA